MSKASAWVMKVDETFYASVSQMELVHIINSPYTINIPKSPEYCQNLIIWNDNILPVVDLSRLLINVDSSTIHDVVAVITYKDSNNNIQYGGISLSCSPDLEHVENNQICELPENIKNLQTISLSCFLSKDGYEVPILDLNKLFSRKYSEDFIRQHC